MWNAREGGMASLTVDGTCTDLDILQFRTKMPRAQNKAHLIYYVIDKYMDGS